MPKSSIAIGQPSSRRPASSALRTPGPVDLGDGLLGDVEPDACRGEAVPVEDARAPVRRCPAQVSWLGLRLSQMISGADALPVPGRELGARGLEHERAERRVEPGDGGGAEELVGEEQPARRMLPADERFHARDAVGGEIERRLPVHDQLAAGRGLAEAGLGVEMVEHPAPERVVVDDGTVAASVPWRRTSRCRHRGAPLSGLSVSASARATPMLVPTLISWPSGWNGMANASRTRSAISTAASGSVISSQQITNSSPPSRATVSSGRTVARRRVATSRSRASPPAWPMESLTALKWSTSRKSTATPDSRRSARSSAWASRSRRRARFGQAGEAVVEGLVEQRLLGRVPVA